MTTCHQEVGEEWDALRGWLTLAFSEHPLMFRDFHTSHETSRGDFHTSHETSREQMRASFSAQPPIPGKGQTDLLLSIPGADWCLSH